MSENSLGAFRACAICVVDRLVRQGLDKVSFQYQLQALGKKGSNNVCMEGNGITLIQLKMAAARI